jgi:hypothetical protein
MFLSLIEDPDQVQLVCHLQYFPKSSTPVLKQVASAFPALHNLVLEDMSISRADLSNLAACSSLCAWTSSPASCSNQRQMALQHCPSLHFTASGS